VKSPLRYATKATATPTSDMSKVSAGNTSGGGNELAGGWQLVACPVDEDTQTVTVTVTVSVSVDEGPCLVMVPLRYPSEVTVTVV